ncbi:MAG: hypothetical protein HY909_14550 [Deltaproteobacteria bacterium]|nr:hypothetical protein [Deltaproteobacteria bacterium]
MRTRGLLHGLPWALACALAFVGCSEDPAPTDAGGADTRPADSGGMDTGGPADSGGKDTGTPPGDTATQDTGTPPGDGMTRCTGNPDCAGTPATPVCDTISGTCVMCLAASDSCPPAQHCDPMTNACVAGCRADEGCAGSPATPRCNTMTHMCVGCVTSDQCPAGMLCMGGACAMGCDPMRPCPTGQSCCSGMCLDTQTNPMNCGTCGNACTAANGVAGCAAGACTVASCSAGFGDCDMMAANGCEASTATSAAHCGRCGSACMAGPRSTAMCAMGACAVMCEAGFADCDMMASNGCEVDTRSNPMRCGGCGTVCSAPNAVATCAAGVCGVGACNAGFGNCDMMASNGCETDLRASVMNCGACGTACRAVANGTAGCAMGTCGVGMCNAGFGDCNAMAADGCEANTNTSAAHCGRCSNACSFANAAGACAAGACALGACNAGFGNCDMMAMNGCEVNTRTDARNCGVCGTVCAAGASCVAGVCQFGRGGADLTLTDRLVINSVRASASVAAGTARVTITNVMGTFLAGQSVLLHQTQAATGPVGHYEYGRIREVSEGAITLEGPATGAYVTDGTHRAQVVVVEERGNVTVPNDRVLTAPAWDGNNGGILVLDVAGALTVAGHIDMDGQGFRGRSHPGTYRCMRGFQGEGQLGVGSADIASNGSGGGGGGAGQDDGAGGGGGHGAMGAGGPPRDPGGSCAERSPIPGGAGGVEVGAADLSRGLFMGGAGGEGGADEDGCHPGRGGLGGGIILVRARSITVAATGLFVSSGDVGVRGDSSCGGCGMGGGGGGAGGSVRLVALTTATFGTGRLRVEGAEGALGTCGSNRGGSGARGRIGVRATSITGETTPAFDRN